MIDAVLGFLQWPGMAFAIMGAPLVASASASRRSAGFTLWLISNGCWLAWGLHTGTWSLFFMQLYFLATSWCGRKNNRKLAQS